MEARTRLKATDHFRVEKYAGKWWLVDPEGYLFWSHGICVERLSQPTPIKGREYYFKFIPENGDFLASNLKRKYGDNWKGIATEIVHKRLRSWGINTIGNWGEEDIYLKRKTPYVASIDTRSWIKREFPNIDNPSWRESFETNLKQMVAQTKDAPWCIGYFVDNEIHGSLDPERWEKYYQIVSQKKLKKCTK
jgi:hypothetical protein